jgi:Dolichyl-phosphate-mannose-protein mannosyltransferase
VGRRTIGEPAATVAAAIFWVWPAYLVWKSSRAHGFYASGLVLGTFALLLVLRLAERRSLRDTALLGLTLGLGAWQTPQIVPIVVPALAWLTLRRRSVWRDAWVAAPLVLVGALPSILSNVRHDWWSLRLDSGDTPYVPRLRGFFSATMPMTLGIRVPFTSEWLMGAGLSALLYAALAVALGIVAWRRRASSVLLLVAVVVAYPLLSTLSPSTWITDEPRYVLMAVPALVLLLASPLVSPTRAWAGLAVALALTSVTLLRIPGPEYDKRADGQFVPRELGPLVTELDRRKISAAYADYWVAYPLLFRTDERIVVAEADLATVAVRGGRVAPKVPKRASDIRWRPYDDSVRGAPEPGWVLLAGSDSERRWKSLLERERYVRTQVGGFAVYGRRSAGSGQSRSRGEPDENLR